MTSIAWYRAKSQRRHAAEAHKLNAEAQRQRAMALRRRQMAAVIAANQAQRRTRSLLRLLADQILELEELDQDGAICLVDPAGTRAIERIARLCPRRHSLAILVSGMFAFEPEDPDRSLLDREMLRRAKRCAKSHQKGSQSRPSSS